MKRVVSFIAVLVLCMSLAVPAFASDVEFVPSITAKPAPEVNNTTENVAGEPVIEVKNESDEVVHTAPVEYLVVTSVAEVMAAEEVQEEVGISEEAAATLKEAYETLNEENAKLSEIIPELVDEVREQVGEEAGSAEELVDSLVVVDLFDVTILEEELEQYLEEEGNTIELTFKANVAPDQNVFVMVYKENEWQLIESAVNNGDGTITCVFEHFCPVAILTAPIVTEEETEPATEAPATEAPATEAPATEAPATEAPATEGGSNMWLIILIAVAAVAVVVVVMKRKGAKENV